MKQPHEITKHNLMNSMVNVLIIINFILPDLLIAVKPVLANAINEFFIPLRAGSYTNPGALISRPEITRPDPRRATRPTTNKIQDIEQSTQSANDNKVNPINAEAPTDISDMLFIENIGQFDSKTKFQLRGAGGILQFSSGELWLTFTDTETHDDFAEQSLTDSSSEKKVEQEVEKRETKPVRGTHLRVKFTGANPTPSIEGFDPLDVKVSFFKGADDKDWVTEVPVWGGIRYLDIYPGMDLEISGPQGNWVWNLVVKDEALLQNYLTVESKVGVGIKLEGSKALSLNENFIEINAENSTLRMPLPTILHSDGTEYLQNRSTNSYEIRGEEVILLETPLTEDDGKNETDPLPDEPSSTPEVPTDAPPVDGDIIETPTPDAPIINTVTPSLPDAPDYEFSLQPSRINDGHKEGTGKSPLSALMPVSPKDIKQETLGSLRYLGIEDLFYSTYMGGSLEDAAHGITVDNLGNAYISAQVFSPDFPTTPGSFEYQGDSDIVVAKLNKAGSRLIYATYIGGAERDCHWGCTISVDYAGNAYIAGSTTSSDFPTTSNAFDRSYHGSSDGFVLRLNQSGTALGYSTYLGGGGNDYIHSIAIESGLAVYVTGMTTSSNYPITNNPYDASKNGEQDVFVSKLNTLAYGLDSLVYSTYYGGSSWDQGHGIAVLNGLVFVTGQTKSTDLPIENAIDSSYNGGWDSFVMKLDKTGRNLIYSTYLGGSGDDCETAGDYKECYIAVDSQGAAYVTGKTESSNFPMANAIDSVINDIDIYISKISPGGNILEYSTFYGGMYGDIGLWISVDRYGSAYVTGYTDSPDFPTTENAFDRIFSNKDAFVLKLIPNGTGVAYSTFWGGSGYDIATSIVVDIAGIVYLSGHTTSYDFPVTPYSFDQSYNEGTDTFISKLGLGQYRSPVPAYSIFSPCDDTRECPPYDATQGAGGIDVNTNTGGQNYSNDDLSQNSSTGELALQRSYSSIALDRTTEPLGNGWTHNHDIRLIFPGDPDGEEGSVLFKGSASNLYKFSIVSEGIYQPAPGLTISLTRLPGTPVVYIITDSDQRVYTFNEEGKITNWADAQGFDWDYSYQNGLLYRVTDNLSQHYLQFNYGGQDRLVSVIDDSGRDVSFSYDQLGNLETFTDVYDRDWAYEYDGSLLEKVFDPDGNTVLHTEYDVNGKVYQQFDARDQLLYTFSYNQDGSTTITDSYGNSAIHLYDDLRTLVYQQESPSIGKGKTFDENFKPDSIWDGNGNLTSLSWSDNGINLNKITDGESNQTDLVYDDLNNLEQIIDQREYLTTFTYNINDPDPTRRTLLLEVEDPYLAITHYTYTTIEDAPQPPGLLKSITDPLDHTTFFTYNALGQQISQTNALDETTHYTYDSLGRLKTTDYPEGRVDWLCYDDGNRIVRTVTNASGDGGSPQTDPCNTNQYQPSEDPSFDLINSTFYDSFGNVIAIIDANGVINRTYYDENQRPIIVIQNWYGNDFINDPAPAYDPDYPDRNIRTETIYDIKGRNIATIDSNGLITRTYYDENDRPISVLSNWQGPDIYSESIPDFNPSFPDRNLRTDTFYDFSGNIIAISDANNHITRTYYDGNNRPIAVVSNWYGIDIYSSDIPTYNPAYPDENILSLTIYDPAGNAIASMDRLGITTRTYYDALNRPIIIITNWVGEDIYSDIPPEYDPQIPNQNLRTDYVYDNAGNQIAVIDPRGVLTRTYYDDVNRPISVVQNWVGTDFVNDPLPSYDSDYPDQNVRVDTIYDAQGRMIASKQYVGNEEVITRYYYDSLNRTVAIVRGWEGVDLFSETIPSYNEQYPDKNVLTQYIYDEKGNSIAVIENSGIITRSYYDELNRVRYVVKNLVGVPVTAEQPPAYDPDYPDQNVRTENVYDAMGNIIRTINVMGRVRHNCYDGQYRIFKTVENPTVSNPCIDYEFVIDSGRDVYSISTFDKVGNRTKVVDSLGKEINYQFDGLNRLLYEQDALGQLTQYQYDRAGNRIIKIDAKNVSTRYDYDELGRLITVFENYKPGFSPDHQTNVRTDYTYDPNGNRLTIVDGNNHQTSFQYDPLNRLVTETDALDNMTTNGYDAVGNLVWVLDANEAFIAYTYDAQNRLTGIDYPDPDDDVEFHYDAAGNRDEMSDGTGTTHWDFDDLGRPLTITDGNNDAVNYTYNGGGNRTSLTYPSTKAVSYDYDLMGRLHQITSWDSLFTTYDYYKNGRTFSITRPNDLVSIYGYDDSGQLESIIHQQDEQTLGSYEYAYDETGNRSSVTETMREVETGAADLIFADGFESGDLLEWSSSVIDNGDLEANDQASFIGSYSLSATIDDNNPIYVIDESPQDVQRYRVRFYFDPNNIAMGHGNTHTIFWGLDSSSNPLLRVEFRYSAGDYQIQAGTLNDSSAWNSLPWKTITDGPHAIEIDWKAAGGIGANNGSLVLWIDGAQVGGNVAIDNDTRRIDAVRLGSVDGIDNDTRGVEIFDAFESRSDTYIGIDPTAPIPPSMPAKTDLLFSDSFETSDFSAWSLVYPDGGDLTINAQAAITEDLGMQATVNDINNLFVRDWNPYEEKQYRVRFYIDPYSLNLANGNALYILKGYDRDDNDILRVEFRQSVGDYQLRIDARNDATGFQASQWFTILDGPHAVEVNWKASTQTGVNNGQLGLWIDGLQRVNISNIDNDTRKIDYIDWGIVSGVDQGTQGSCYFDGFKSRRYSFIGLDPSAPPAPTKGDLIYEDGFESGTLSGWAFSQTDGGDLAVDPAAAIIGSLGMQSVIDDNNAIYVTDWSPSEESHYFSRFYFDPNSIMMGDGDSHSIFSARDRLDYTFATIEFRFSAGDYQVRAVLTTSGGSWSTPWVTITDGPHALEIEWKAATGPSTLDGGLWFWIDGMQQGNITGKFNPNDRIDYILFGSLSGIDTTTRGTYYFDGFASKRETSIGLDPNAAQPPQPPVKGDQLFADDFETGDFTRWSRSVVDSGDLSVSR